MIYFILFITFLFTFYSEYSVGNILLSPNSSGKLSFNLNSLFHFMIHPFFNQTLWTWNTLDINYPFVLGYSLLIYTLV